MFPFANIFPFIVFLNCVRRSVKLCSAKMSTETKEVKIEETNNDQSFLKWRKAKKVAVMVSFVGKDYLGMQRYEISFLQ